MKLLKYTFFVTFLLLLLSPSAEAQLFKKKKKKTSVSGFTLQEAPTEEQRKKAAERQMVSPVRKFLNGFNFHVQKGFGLYNYQSSLSEVAVIRHLDTDALYLLSTTGEGNGTTVIKAYENWFSNLTGPQLYNINPANQMLRTDTVDFTYRNRGNINPWTFRLDYSFKKVDKEHQQRTGEKRYLDQDQLRVGVGFSFGSFKWRDNVHQQEVDPMLGNYQIPTARISSTKMFGSISYHVYQIGGTDIFADVYGGVWNSKTQDINETFVTYDPFFNVGIMFQTTWSKYFKGYIRPSFEMRSYTLADDLISVPHQFNVFSIDIGLILKYPTYPRNKFKADMVQMEHVFNGKIYRGRPFYRKQNPRTGQRRNSRRGDGFDFPVRKNKGGGE